MVGTVIQAMRAVLEWRGRGDFGDDVALMILQGLGVDGQRIKALIAISLPTIRPPIRRVA